MTDAKYFFTLDVSAGFWQVPLVKNKHIFVHIQHPLWEMLFPQTTLWVVFSIQGVLQENKTIFYHIQSA